MQKLKRIMRKGFLYVAALVLIGSPSIAVHAEDETYYYDETSGRWNTSKWTYDPATNTYKPTIAASTPPPAPEQSTETNDAEEPASGDSSAADTTTTTGPSSNNETNEETTVNSNTTINGDKKITNDLDSDATTGNAGVTQNTNGGNAQTGKASADATIVNSVHSSVGSGENSGVAHFTIDLYGDVYGDIVIGPDATKNATKTTNIDSKTNVNNNDSITNNVDLSVQSGDANVKGNTIAGSAQSGDADAVVNLLNLVNTVIAANKSFVGTINIHGNMHGDILMSPEFIPQLLASNGNSTSENTLNLPLSTNINDDTTIVNNINLDATSGTATVKDNTSAGTAKTGEAQTNLQILNLTNREVDAEDALLVFVNVKGKWVGMLLDAPGATAAAYGSGVTKNSTTLADTVNVNNKTAITNNVNVTAVSGDANVESNTSGGDATTGNASASANIANLVNSKFNIKKNITILYINVFGDLYGIVGANSPEGDMVSVAAVPISQTPPEPAVGSPNVRLGYVPMNVNDNTKTQLMNATSGENQGDPYASAVLASASSNLIGDEGQPLLKQSMSPREDPFSTIMMIGGFGIAGIYGLIAGVRRLLGR